MKAILLFLIPILSWSQIPAYYSSIDFSQSPENIKQQLTILVTTTHITVLPYTSGSTDTWDALKQTDTDYNNSNNVLLLYGFNDSDADTTNDRSRAKNLSCHTNSCNGLWVREHTYPRSLGMPNLGFDNAGSDAHNLRAIDYQRNNSRSNRMFEESSGVNTNQSYITSSGKWHPGLEWIGDVARMMMYMYIRYPEQCAPTNVGSGSTSYSNLGDMPNIFLDWNAAGPVSPYELQRNNILEQLQGNRNQFIDNPYLATILWNGPPTIDSWNSLSVFMSLDKSQILIWPTVCYNTVHIGSSTSHFKQFAIYNLSGQEVYNGQAIDTINIESISRGMYILKVEDGLIQFVKKIVKL